MDPKTYFFHYLDHAIADINNRVWFTMVTNQGAGGSEPQQRPAVASYALGDLGLANDERLVGPATQYFSDRRRPGAPVAPFDPTRTEDLTVEIGMGGDDLQITLTNHTWGNAQQTLTHVHEHDGALVATGGSVGNQTPSASYVITLGQSTGP
jgi:hypothetical protein